MSLIYIHDSGLKHVLDVTDLLLLRQLCGLVNHGYETSCGTTCIMNRVQTRGREKSRNLSLHDRFMSYRF